MNQVANASGGVSAEYDRARAPSTRIEGSACERHGLPLNFWQDKEQAYACIKCLIDEGEVHFVDKSYEGRLRRFNKIKQQADRILRENQSYTHTIADWKDDIRDMLLRVREQVNEFIEMFTNKFIRQISKMDHERQDLAAFAKEDNHQAVRLQYIAERCDKINTVLNDMATLPPNLLAKATQDAEEEILRLDLEVRNKDAEMKQTQEQVSSGLRSAIELNGLSHRLFQKYNDFIQAQINLATKEKPTLLPKS